MVHVQHILFWSKKTIGKDHGTLERPAETYLLGANLYRQQST
jgi:hypothetical protein